MNGFHERVWGNRDDGEILIPYDVAADFYRKNVGKLSPLFSVVILAITVQGDKVKEADRDFEVQRLAARSLEDFKQT